MSTLYKLNKPIELKQLENLGININEKGHPNLEIDKNIANQVGKYLSNKRFADFSYSEDELKNQSLWPWTDKDSPCFIYLSCPSDSYIFLEYLNILLEPLGFSINEDWDFWLCEEEIRGRLSKKILTEGIKFAIKTSDEIINETDWLKYAELMYNSLVENDDLIFDDYWNNEVLLLQRLYSDEIKAEPIVENITNRWNRHLDCYEFKATIIYPKNDVLIESHSDLTKEINIRIHPTKEKRFQISNNYVMFGDTPKDLFDTCIPAKLIEHVLNYIQNQGHQNFCLKIQNPIRFKEIFPFSIWSSNLKFVIDIQNETDLDKVEVMKNCRVRNIILNYKEPVGDPNLKLENVEIVKFSKELFNKCMEEKLNWLGIMWQNCRDSSTGFYRENDNWKSAIQHILYWDEHQNKIEYYICLNYN